MKPVRLPIALRAWSVLGRRFPPHLQRSVALHLSRRTLDPQTPYRTPNGFAFRGDATDAFQAMMLAGLYDRRVLRALRRHAAPGSVAIDAGAQLGYFTLCLAQLVGESGEVHAFEPDPRAAPLLREQIAVNNLATVSVNEVGLFDHDAAVELALPDVLGWASILPGAWGASATASVKMRALDDYVAERGTSPTRISVIKIDVEGAELEVLRGAQNTLHSARAAVVVEHLPGRMRERGQDPGDVFRLMQAAGYDDPSWVTDEDLLFVKRP